MSESTIQPKETPATKRSRKGLWWGLSSAVIIVCLAVAAAIAIPKYLHAQRVAAYTEFVTLTNAEIAETNALRETAERTAVLYGLQLPEVAEFIDQLETLSQVSERTYTDAHRASVAQAIASLAEVTDASAFTAEEETLVGAARDTIETEGYIWQTGFLNLGLDATEQVIELSPTELIVPVADEDVTQQLVDEAEARLGVERELRVAAEQMHDTANERAKNLEDTMVTVLASLVTIAESTPEIMQEALEQYTDAAAEAVDLMSNSSLLATESVQADLFTYKDEVTLPVMGEVTEDMVTFEVTDAWRAIAIAAHLQEFKLGVNSAWVTDAGSIEAALGFNPFLPFG